MSQPYLAFDFPIERTLRVREAHEVLKDVMGRPPTRATLLNWLEEGKLEGKQMSFGWIIYERSLTEFIRSMQPQGLAA